MKTLILIDVQNDFIPGGSLAVPEGDQIIAPINSMLDKFDLVIATQDWHPHNHKSFASNHPGKKVFEQIELQGLEQTLWPNHCVQQTRGAAFHPDLQTGPIEAIFHKGMDPEIDSYSGFFDNGHKKSTGLSGYLKEKKATELYLCGLAADICVYYSIIDAIELGFSVNLVDDASRPLDRDEFEVMKKELEEKGCKILNSHQI